MAGQFMVVEGPMLGAEHGANIIDVANARDAMRGTQGAVTFRRSRMISINEAGGDLR